MSFEHYKQRVQGSSLPQNVKNELITSFEKDWVETDERMRQAITWAQNQAKEELLQSYTRHLMQLQALTRELKASPESISGFDASLSQA